jgi:hypothetical protein
VVELFRYVVSLCCSIVLFSCVVRLFVRLCYLIVVLVLQYVVLFFIHCTVRYYLFIVLFSSCLCSFFLSFVWLFCIHSLSLFNQGGDIAPTVSVSFSQVPAQTTFERHHRDFLSFLKSDAKLIGAMHNISTEMSQELMQSDPTALLMTQSIVFSSTAKAKELQTFGNRMIWTPKTHRFFSASFRAAAKTFVQICRTTANPLGKVLPKDVVHCILRELGELVSLRSPLDNPEWAWPALEKPSQEDGEDM